MIYVTHNNEVKEVTAIYIGNKEVSSAYREDSLIYSGFILICFSNGYWVDQYPWMDQSHWMD